MNSQLYIPILLILPFFLLTSCDTDDDHIDDDHTHHHDECCATGSDCCNTNNNNVVAPETYVFERNGESTVSYGGQTCRLQMAKDIYDALNSSNNEFSADQVLTMFNDGIGFAYAYDCGKNVGGKTAASPSASSTVKPLFDQMITEYFEVVEPNFTNNASIGIPGQITTSGGNTYQVNGQGLEIDQAFIKGLIGAMCVDQMTNNYLTSTKLDGDGTTNETANLGTGEYTDMEHYWDEGYGYLYGYNDTHLGGSSDNATGVAVGSGVLLNKYLKKINESNEPGIADIIYDAFKLGRAAIVAGNYTLRDEQAQIITSNVHKLIAYKAVDYLRGGATTIAAGSPMEDTFHGLSEGYGFVLSLQFTNYFSNSEVNSMLDQLMEGDGFWDITADELNSMADQIESVAGL